MERLIPWAVLAAGVAAYHGSLQNAFVFDDLAYIVENPQIRSLWQSGEIPTRSTRPVIRFSFAVNYALGGLDPWGYHLVNVGIHLLAALLLFGVVRRSLCSERLGWKWAGSAPWAAGIVAVLWVVHPLQTQSVTYVWQRCESLMGMFYLLTLYCVIRSDRSARATWWAAGAVVSCALGMASKEVMVTAPVLVLLYDRVFLAGSWRELRRRRWGLHAGLAGTWVILAGLLGRGATQTGVWKSTWLAASRSLTPGSYLLTQAGVIVHYLRLALWPDPLCLDYGPAWPVARTIADAWPGLILVGGLLLITAWAWWRRPALGFVGAWFFLILSPTSSFVPMEDLVFEHRMYLSLAAVIVLLVVAAVELLGRLPGPGRRLQWGTGGVALALVITLAALTTRRNQDYRSPLTIWQDTVTKAPQNPRAHNNWGLALKDSGRVEEAMAQYQEALRIEPSLAAAHNNWGNALLELGRLDEAIAHYRETLRVTPNYAKAHYNWGLALQGRGRIEEAMAHYQQALRIRPNFARAQYSWASALQGLGRLDEAVAHYQEALRIRPNDAEAHYGFALALQDLGRTEEATAQHQEALRLKPDLAFGRNQRLRAEARPD